MGTVAAGPGSSPAGTSSSRPPRWSPTQFGRVGRSRSFRLEIDSFIHVPFRAELDLPGAITVEAWVCRRGCWNANAGPTSRSASTATWCVSTSGGELDSQFASSSRIRGSDAPLLIGNFFDPRLLTRFGGDLRPETGDTRAPYAFNGLIDELRISRAARSDFPSRAR